MTIRKIGGLWHWRIGRLGGCLYLSRRIADQRRAFERETTRLQRIANREVVYQVGRG